MLARIMRWVLFFAALIGFAMSPAASAAGVELSWTGPEGCGDPSPVRAQFETLVGAGRRDLSGRVEAVVTREDNAWLANVTLERDGATTQRVLRSADCAELGDAVALVAAVAFDPIGTGATVSEALTAPAHRPVAPAAVTTTRAAPSTSVPPDAEARPHPARFPVRGSLMVLGGGAVGILPTLGGLLGGGPALQIGRARVEVVATHRFAVDVRQPQRPTAGARISLTTGRASGCWAPGFRRFTLPLCAGIEVGAFTARGFGLTSRLTTTPVWVAGVAHLRPSFAPTRWLVIGVEAQLPVSLLRPRIGIDDFSEDLVQAGPVGFRFGLSIELIFFDESGRRRAS